MQNISADAYIEPFPHLVFHNFYTDEELDLIWEELNFYTRPKKLFDVEDYQGVVGYTKAKALHLDSVYTGKNRVLSNILEVSRKVLDKQVRYYHNGDYYKPHTDTFFEFLAFSYFYKEPKKFDGGNLIFPKYDYEFSCGHNSLIMMPAWVEHGVSEVSIKDSDYYDGYGRYAITHFFGCKEP